MDSILDLQSDHPGPNWWMKDGHLSQWRFVTYGFEIPVHLGAQTEAEKYELPSWRTGLIKVGSDEAGRMLSEGTKIGWLRWSMMCSNSSNRVWVQDNYDHGTAIHSIMLSREHNYQLARVRTGGIEPIVKSIPPVNWSGVLNKVKAQSKDRCRESNWPQGPIHFEA